MQITAYSHTQKGGRPVNEDALAVWSCQDKGVFLLADGLGGHRYGEVASRTVVDTMMAVLRAMPENRILDGEALRATFLQAGHMLLERQKSMGTDMMTTAVALIVVGGKAVWGHVGDSRLYYFSRGRLAACTQDHSVSFKKYLSGEITWEAINHDEDRCGLLRAVGARERDDPEIAETQALRPGDAFLLCSDGFWESLSGAEIEAALAHAQTPDAWAQQMLELHGSRATPCSDNASLITVFVEETAGQGRG